MSETVRRITLALSKADNKYLELLCSGLGENQSAVIKRAIEHYYHHVLIKKQKDKKIA